MRAKRPPRQQQPRAEGPSNAQEHAAATQLHAEPEHERLRAAQPEQSHFYSLTLTTSQKLITRKRV
jgi:hypothetical protein